MPKKPSKAHPYTQYAGGNYRYSSIKNNVSTYLCTWYFVDGIWKPIFKTGAQHCCGVLKVDESDDAKPKIYFSQEHT